MLVDTETRKFWGTPQPTLDIFPSKIVPVTMVDFEVVLRPNFKAQDPHEVLGLHSSAGIDEIYEAYRRWSWKYHPGQTNSNEPSRIFVRIAEAYYSLISEDDGGVKWYRYMTSEKAMKAYERTFGKFRKLYYHEGGIVGLPHGFALQEELNGNRERRLGCVSCGKAGIGFFRSWFLKMKIDWVLALIEVVLTWGVVAAGVLYHLALHESFEWYINIMGGVGVLLASCQLSFWYGFTRYPMALEDEFSSWVNGERSQKEMDEIRDVCSRYYHGDRQGRSPWISLVVCSPVVLLDQLAACSAMLLISLLLIPIRLTIGISSSVDVVLWGVAKTAGAVLLAIGYYALWVLGGNIAKFCVMASLLCSQTLYTSILCRMNFWEFIWLSISRGVISVSIRRDEDEPAMKCDVEVVEQSREDWSDEVGRDRKHDSNVARTAVVDLESNPVRRSESGSTKTSSTSSGDVEDGIAHAHWNDSAAPGCHSFSMFQSLRKTKDHYPKGVDFTGEVYSKRLQVEAITDSSVGQSESSTFPSIMQSIKKRMEERFPAIKKAPPEEAETRVPGFVRSSTAMSSLFSRPSGSVSADPCHQRQTTARSCIANALCAPADDEFEDVISITHTASDSGIMRIVGNIEPCKSLSSYGDPDPLGSQLSRSLEAASLDETIDVQELTSLHPSIPDQPTAPTETFEATTASLGQEDVEAPPPSTVTRKREAEKTSCLENFEVLREANTTLGSLADTSRSSWTLGSEPQVPEHVSMMIGGAASVDDEDVTLAGFAPHSPLRDDPRARRGRRPAPGKIDLEEPSADVHQQWFF